MYMTGDKMLLLLILIPPCGEIPRMVREYLKVIAVYRINTIS